MVGGQQGPKARMLHKLRSSLQHVQQHYRHSPHPTPASLVETPIIVSSMGWVDIGLRFFRIMCELLGRFLCWIWYRDDPHIPLPPIKNLILLEPAQSLATKIRTKKLKSVDVVKSFIARIEEINPIVNCMTDQRFEDALKEAEEADSLIRSGSIDEGTLTHTKPFLGVPFTIKDCFAVKGLKQVAGLWLRRDFIADKDADCVALMRASGAIILCVTNVSELCMWWESNNTVYGRTNNPYRTCRIVGGSSGGEACIQSSCGAAIGIGSDIGGSIRMPSFFNGIFGHKPSYGIVSNYGQEPVAVGEAQEFCVTGPMCRYASDLAPMLKVIAGNNAYLLKLDQKVDIQSLRYYYVEDDGGSPLITPMHPELRAAQRKVVQHLDKAYGIKAKKISLKKLKFGLGIYFAKLGNIEGAHLFAEELALQKGSINVWLEVFKWIFRLSKHTLPALSLCIIEKFNGKQNEHFPKMLTMCDDLRTELKELLGDDGVLLFPSHATTAPYHNQPIFRGFNFIYTGIINMLKFPSTQCPLGIGLEGTPLGIQVVSNHLQDHLTLAVAQELEKAFGGWVCPSEVL